MSPLSWIRNATRKWNKLDNRLPKFVADGVRYVPSFLLPTLSALLASIVFTRLFRPATYGQLTLLIAIVAPLVSVVSQPVAQPAGRFFFEYKAQDQLGLYRAAIRQLLGYTLLISIGLGAVGLGLVRMVGVPKTYSTWLIGGAMALMIIQVLSAVLQPILSAGFHIAAYRRIVVGTSVLSFVLPLTGVLMFGRHISWLLWGPAIASAAFFPVLVRDSGLSVLGRRDSVSRTAIRPVVYRFLRFGTPMAIWFLAFSLLGATDRYVIQAVQGTKAVGIYGVSYALAAQGTGILTGPFLSGSWPRLVQQWTNNDRMLVRKTLAQMTDLYLMIGIALVGGMAVVGHGLLRVLVGSAFTVGFPILVPVTAGRVLVGASHLGHKSMELAERNGVMVWDASIAAVINLGLNIWAVPKWGIIGAGYASFASYGIYTGLIWWQSRHFLPWDLHFTRILIYMAEAMCGWVIAQYVANYVFAVPWLAVIVGGTIFVATYAGLEIFRRWYLSRRRVVRAQR